MKKDILTRVKLTDNQKEANGKRWYKEKIDNYATMHSSANYYDLGSGDKPRYNQIKINTDLYNNKLDFEDFKRTLNPYGKKIANVTDAIKHRDILSPKMNAVIGIELSRPFKWKAFTVNPEATTRIEQEETKRMRDYVVNAILAPIRAEIEKNKLQEQQGQEVTPEQEKQLQAQIEQEVKAMTPERVKKYMKREHSDPAEVLAKHLLNYNIQKLDIDYKFMLGLLDMVKTNSEIYYVGIVSDNPVVEVIRPERFTTDAKSNVMIQDNEWAVVEYRMSFSEVVRYFNKYLTTKQLQDISDAYKEYNFADEIFAINAFDEEDFNKIKVLHVVWKDLRKLQILTYEQDGNIYKKFVTDDYILNEEAGDISLTEEWITETYEGWKISDDVYINMGPVPSQIKDVDDIHSAKLPYYGILNPVEGSLVSRAKHFTYLYDAAIFHIERLMASDKGKKVMVNIKSIPQKQKLKDWLNYFEVSPMTFFDPSQEGTGYNDINTSMKVVDLSLVSDISKYIEIAKFAREQIGIITGIPDELEGRISPYMTSENAKQTQAMSSNILEVMLKLHNLIKKDVLMALIEASKLAYKNKPGIKLSYILDDMTKEYFEIDVELLKESTYGIFIENSGKAQELRQSLIQLTHAALQNQAMEMSDAIRILREEGITEDIEILKVSEEKKREREDAKIQQEQQAQAELQDKIAKQKEAEHEAKIREIIVKEEERRKTELLKAELLGASFNPDQDKNNNGVNDFIEMYRKDKELMLKEKELNAKIALENKKLALENKKLNSNQQK